MSASPDILRSGHWYRVGAGAIHHHRRDGRSEIPMPYRNISASKEFQNLWRPELCLVGAIIEGVQEIYYVCDCDISKNADLHCAIVGHCLEVSQAAFQARGRCLPRYLRIHTDNASAEGKNSTAFFLASWLASRNLFDSVVLTQFRVGHTHGKIDQRFSEIRGALGQCTILEDPTSFCEAILAGVQPREKRELAVHRITATPSFKRYFESLEIKVSGHLQTKWQKMRNEEAVHCFNFCRRDHWSDPLDDLRDESPQGGDVIMSCRQYLSDSELSQKPLVFAQASDFLGLAPEGPTELSPRAAFSQRQIREFTKTAECIAREPWCMNAGCSYLLKVIQENQDNASDEWIPPPMSWMISGVTPPPARLEPEQVPTKLDANTFNWNHTKPAPVQVARPPLKLRRLQVKQP